VQTTDTGAQVSRTVHVGDGGHRLALLLQSGSDLMPHMYRLDPRPMPLIDNTAVLLGPLGIGDADYCAFVGAGYGRHGFPDVQALLAAVARDDRASGAELASVLEAHARMPRPVV
jgi:hypothetical protein